MTAHVAEGSGSETHAPAPLAGMIHTSLERPGRARAEPVVPREGSGDRIDRVRQRLIVTPVLVRERVHFPNLADDPASHQRLAVALRPAR